MAFNEKDSLEFYSKFTYDQLVSTVSDYHKDVHGFRLRMNGEPREEILRQLVLLDRYCGDPANRAQLESEGWIFEEPTGVDELEALQHMQGMDPHFWGPGFDEDPPEFSEQY